MKKMSSDQQVVMALEGLRELLQIYLSTCSFEALNNSSLPMNYDPKTFGAYGPEQDDESCWEVAESV